MKSGDRVKIVDWSGLTGYQFYPRLKKQKKLTVSHIKKSGGVIFNEITIGFNMFGEEQGIYKERLRVIKPNSSPIKIIDEYFKKELSKKQK